MKINEGLREAIKNTGMSESEFARRLGWTRQKLSKTILGQRQPKLAEVQRISELLNMPVDKVMTIFMGKRIKDAGILTGLYSKITIADINTGEEIAVITTEAITTARDNIVVRLTPRRD